MWNIAKSAEAMFSSWAVKKLCKFLLKKKLGQFILGDIDLNQLDVQLRAGTIQLSDLALNVDYINQKLGAVAALIVKEGSIGSLSVTMPWKGKGCQIEVDELELVLGLGGRNISQVESKTCFSRRNGQDGILNNLGKLESETMYNNLTTASVDVHEGVKTIAKMVKWLLTSFHVKIKNLIVAFDPYSGDKKNKGFCRILVLRITEIECGTGTSEEANSDNHVTVDNFLGLNRLTNFVKFHGAILEFLQMDDDDDNQLAVPCASGATFGEWFKGCRPSNSTTPIVTGGRGGFSGNIKLSMPWKNGSLDIRKVDADIYVDPLELRFQPSSIKCFLHLWDIYKDVDEFSDSQMHSKETESVYYSATSKSLSSTLGSCMSTTEKVLSNLGSSSTEICYPIGKETVIDSLLPGSHVISDWVSSISRNQRDCTEVEPDFGASVDQFFECFDELRTAQSALGNSGMWNWTCSVFSAITAASNLATGSLHIPTEQKHVETNLKATIAGVSLLFSFVDEDPMHLRDKKNSCSFVHYVGANIQSMLFILQVCPQEMNFKATVECIELADYFSSSTDVDLHGYSDDVESQVILIGKMQAAVEGSFPLSSPAKYYNLAKPTEFVATDGPLGVNARNRHGDIRNCGSIYRNDVVKVTLLSTSSVTQFLLNVAFDFSYNSSSGPTSFYLKLPPFVFWVNFHLVSMTLDLLREIIDSVEMTGTRRTSLYEAHDCKYRSSSLEKVGKTSCSQVTSSSPAESLRGNIFLPNARIILCFPHEKEGDFRNYSSWHQFIAFDFSSPSTLREEKVQASNQSNVVRSMKKYSSATSYSLHLNVGNLGVYLITSVSKDIVERNSFGLQNLEYFAQNIVSVTDQTGCLSVLSMHWQDGHLTGPLIAESAKLLATSEDLSSRSKSVGKGHDFTSVTTAKDMKDVDAHTREEMILSSSFILHADLAPVKVNLDSSQYKILHSLLHQVIDWLSCLASNPVDNKKESSSPQTSIVVECDFLEFQVSLDAGENINFSIQNELPGCWHRFNLKIWKFELLYVSNIGGISGFDFFWMAHGEGNLWGFITGVPNEKFLLISCSNSTMGRGDGDGSNVLSSRLSGSDIVHLWDPENSLSHTSITIRCGTIAAIGGRLDWVDTVSSFFCLPSPETEQAVDDHLQKGDSERNHLGGSSFVVNLVDFGLSYEPYLCVGAGSANANEEKDENYFSCLLAASSLKLSNTTFADSIEKEYKIGVQELGLLLCPVSGCKNVDGPYSVEHLRNCGYIKVAQEAYVEALLRMNCKNGHLWEVECSDSHIVLDTCHDTASGLIRLASQLQQLFAPDMEESVVHLQNRWNSIQQAHVGNEIRIYNGDSIHSTSQVNSSEDTRSRPGVVNLMDEICEDAFQLNGYWDVKSEFSGLKLSTSLADGRLGKVSNLGTRGPERFTGSLSFTGSVPPIGLESNQTSLSQQGCAEFIEGYFLSDLNPLSELSIHNQPSNEILNCNSKNLKDHELQRGRSGWYGDVALRILENHVSEVSKQTGPQQREEGKAPKHTKHNEYKSVKGCVILKNINVMWRLYGGSDWHNFWKNDQHSATFSGRDTTICLELASSGMNFQYDVFPDGEVCVSRLSLSILDFCLNDNSIDAPWKLVFGYYHSKGPPRESSSKPVKLDLEAVRPHPSTPLEEYRLQVTLLPMRLHLHQRQLDFLIKFFGGKDSSMDQLPSSDQDSGESRMLLKKSTNFGGHNINEEALLPYFQKFDIQPVVVQVDYSPSRVDLVALRGGKYVELVNLVPWKGVELQLKHVQAFGVYGWSCVCETIIGEWLEDISQNQVHKLLKGLPPIRSLVAVGSGTAKLVSLPVRHYRKDLKLLKGMQRGTISFLRSISLEAIGLGVHLSAGAHEILLQAEYILTTIPPSVPWPIQSRVNTNVRSNPPKDAQQGIQQACESISDGLGKSASALVQTPFRKYQRGAGLGSALATAFQAAPAAAIGPVSAATRAVHCALLGVRNSLDLEHKNESMDKYLGTAKLR